MRGSIASLAHYFNSHRMVAEYTDRFYMPAARRHQVLTANEMARAKRLAAWKRHLQDHWPQVQIELVESDVPSVAKVGDQFSVRALICLGELTAHEVHVELYLGLVSPAGDMVGANPVPMEMVESRGEGRYLFEASLKPI